MLFNRIKYANRFNRNKNQFKRDILIQLKE